MAVTTGPSQARAIAAFNPTAAEPGFLQPLLVGSHGDNRSYVQIFSAPDRITAFMEVGWPDRDFVHLTQELMLNIGGQTLWGFVFPNEQPIVSLWSDFRKKMRRRISDRTLVDRPLLQFDIVDTLDLDEAKQDVFTRAYNSYAAMGRATANRWRDRAILEPALVRILPKLHLAPHRTTASEPPEATRATSLPRLRARTENGEVTVHVEGFIGPDQQRGLQEAYEMLVERFPKIFPSSAKVVATHPPRRAGSLPVQPIDITVVLVGRIRQSHIRYSGWAKLGVEVTDESQFQSTRRVRRQSALTIILGIQTDLPQMVDLSREVGEHSAIIVSLSASTTLRLRDIKFLSQTNLPTITLFVPYNTLAFKDRDPVMPIRSIIDVLRREMAEAPQFDLHSVLRAQHNLFLREPVSNDQHLVEVNCRLAARALKAGAIIDGSGRLYSRGSVLSSERQSSANLLSNIFSIKSDFLVHVDDQRAALLLLVERVSHYSSGTRQDQQLSAILRLFEMRGWTLSSVQGSSFNLVDQQRKFEVVIGDYQKGIPREDPRAPAPGLIRAPILVIHTQAQREELLKNNLGQFFHASIEDISLMEPGTPWVWAVLRRQLFDGRTNASQAAIRLCAALIIEAIRQNRVQPSLAEIDWDQIHKLLASVDCERFIGFVGRRIHADRVVFEILPGEISPANDRKIFIQLCIEIDGPVVQIVDQQTI